MYDLIFGILVIISVLLIFSFFTFLNGVAYEFYNYQEAKKLSIVGLLISNLVAIVLLVAVTRISGQESISALIDKVAITSVLYVPGDEEVTITSDGKTFKFKASECEFVVVGEEAATDNLPYYEWRQKETREVIAIFGHRFYDEPKVQTQYIFYVSKDFLENLDYEIERAFWVAG